MLNGVFQGWSVQTSRPSNGAAPNASSRSLRTSVLTAESVFPPGQRATRSLRLLPQGGGAKLRLAGEAKPQVAARTWRSPSSPSRAEERGRPWTGPVRTLDDRLIKHPWPIPGFGSGQIPS